VKLLCWWWLVSVAELAALRDGAIYSIVMLALACIKHRPRFQNRALDAYQIRLKRGVTSEVVPLFPESGTC
jgi:hypothetical protein